MTARIQKKISIPLHTIKEGVSELTFRTRLNEPEVYANCSFNGDVDVSVKLTAGDGDYLCEIAVVSTGHFICDRCLDEFTRKVEASGAVMFTKHSSGGSDETESYHIIEPSATEIDLSEDIIDLLLIEVPVKILCHQECKGLCPECGINLNRDTCTCSRDQIDPRWEGLKNVDFSK